jgi:extracellular factor (EF) 3-hydroxypalmitic acid methyl ester biosynthesis protein
MSTQSENDSHITCTNSQGLALEGLVRRVTRQIVVFTVCCSEERLRLSEALTDFNIMMQGRTVYSGRAIVGKLIDAGTALVCEANLEDGWRDVDLFGLLKQTKGLAKGFAEFFRQWEKGYKIVPAYKVAVSDLHSFLSDLRMWLDQAELGARTSPSKEHFELEREVAQEVGKPALAWMTRFFEECERVAEGLDESLVPVHRTFIQRQLHPLVLCSPFVYRTFKKPLGYAGDYEMINMILGDPLQGSSLFAKIVNAWFHQQPPAKAHRNRVRYLTDKLKSETLRVLLQRRPARILSMGCGPAREVQHCLEDSELANQMHFALYDFNEETLLHLQTVL